MPDSHACKLFEKEVWATCTAMSLSFPHWVAQIASQSLGTMSDQHKIKAAGNNSGDSKALSIKELVKAMNK